MKLKDIMGFPKSKKKVIKEQLKPKKTILDKIKKDILKESYVWERQFGEKLPTLASIQAKKKLNEVGVAQEHKKYIKNIEKAEEMMHKYVAQYKNFLMDQGHKEEAMEFSSNYVTMIVKFTHWLKIKWVKTIRNLI